MYEVTIIIKFKEIYTSLMVIMDINTLLSENDRSSKTKELNIKTRQYTTLVIFICVELFTSETLKTHFHAPTILLQDWPCSGPLKKSK